MSRKAKRFEKGVLCGPFGLKDCLVSALFRLAVLLAEFRGPWLRIHTWRLLRVLGLQA